MKNKKMNDIFKNLLDNYLLISYHIKITITIITKW